MQQTVAFAGKELESESTAMGKSDILQTLGDFTSKENWDNFFTIRGHGDAFEWYAEWPELKDPLISHLPSLSQSLTPQILVPGCGNSSLSEQLYDAGFRCITNIDFSKVAISDMLRRNVRQRPDMRWRVMDMTTMQVSKLLEMNFIVEIFCVGVRVWHCCCRN